MVLINLHKISIPIKGSETIIERAAQFAEKIKAAEEKKLASSLDFLAGQNEFLVKRKLTPETIEKFILEQRNDIDLDIIKYLAKQITPKNAPYLKNLLSLPEEVLKARGKQLDVDEIYSLLKKLTPKNAPYLKGLLSLPEDVLKARGKQLDGSEIAEMLKLGINTEKLEKLHKLRAFDADEFKLNNYLNNFISFLIPTEQQIEQMHKIQRICFGELSEKTIQRVKEFEQKTGIKLYLDKDLPFENIDYLEDTMNVLKSRGLKNVKNIFITDFMPEHADGFMNTGNKSTIFYRPIGYNGCNDIEFIEGIAHESTHSRHNKLDQLEHLMFELENQKGLVTNVISKYATTEPYEFVACVGGEMIFPGKIRIEKQPDGTVEWLSDIVEPDKLKVIKKLYEKFEGPKFAPTPKLIKKSKKQILSH